MPNQSPAIDSFNVLHRTPLLCVCVCMEKENLEGAQFSVLYYILSVAIIQRRDKKYGDGACLLVLIDTNEQGLAEVILAGFRLGGMGRGYLLGLKMII